MDDLDGYKYLCLRSEKNPDANPDFEFVFNSHEEATLCLQINFDGEKDCLVISLLYYHLIYCLFVLCLGIDYNCDEQSLLLRFNLSTFKYKSRMFIMNLMQRLIKNLFIKFAL